MSQHKQTKIKEKPNEKRSKIVLFFLHNNKLSDEIDINQNRKTIQTSSDNTVYYFMMNKIYQKNY